MMENFIICTAIIGPFILGIFLVWGAFAVKNGVIWYFGRILDYEGFELAKLDHSVYSLNRCGYFLLDLVFILGVAINKKNNIFSILMGWLKILCLTQWGIITMIPFSKRFRAILGLPARKLEVLWNTRLHRLGCG
ncbi:hypothetical protein Ocin01_20116 [Orchesella cincta]|uniref:Uncharacterized protein n=1 Tax=Orchesella cincta TaxID=48709 RepID=A0A1D2M0S7_ORCCI|nr:hypothetical protein Ocin01_20116 [Orchesella cincta]